MNLSRPLGVVTPTVDGDVLRVLAGAEAAFTAPQVQALIGDHSVEGVRKSLRRLESQGIVRAERLGQAYSYQLNRDHLAAPYIVSLANLRAELVDRMASVIDSWLTPCAYAALFGSAATGRMRPESDLDVFIVRPDDVDLNDDRWREQLSSLERTVTSWTGNDTRVLEFSASESGTGLRRGPERVLKDIQLEGIHLAGPNSYLRLLRRVGKA